MITDVQLTPKGARRTASWSNWLAHARIPARLTLFIVLVSLLGLFYLNQSSRVSNLGYELQTLNRNREELRREIAELEYEIAALQSLSRVEERAIRLGLSETSEVSLLPVRLRKEEQLTHSSLPKPERPMSADMEIWATLQIWQSQMFSQFMDWIRSPYIVARGAP